MTEPFCPICKTPHKLYPDSYWVHCSSCGHLLAYSKGQLEDHGRKSQLLDQSAEGLFAIGLNGRMRDRWFEIVGRVRYRYLDMEVAGHWDNWYIRFEDNTFGIIVSEGEEYYFYMKRESFTSEIPDFYALQPGSNLNIEGYDAEVFEVGEDVIEFIEGQVPKYYEPGRVAQYVDCQFRNYFVNVEYSKEQKLVFFGLKLAPSDIEMSQTS